MGAGKGGGRCASRRFARVAAASSPAWHEEGGLEVSAVAPTTPK
jgi:hypothetical protein